MKTRLTEMLGIRYPIIQGGMQWIARAELAAAVSEAGGLGIITAASQPTADDLRREIGRVRAMTSHPFGVNISMLPGSNHNDMVDAYFQVVCEEHVPVVETSGRSPEPYVPMLKEAGIRLIHKVPAVRYARKAESVGADAVSIVGFECGGHPGNDDVTTFVLIPKAVRVLQVPIIAGGGIADARGFLAALALGAEGVVMGTRFLASQEAPIPDNFKAWMVQAQETDTVMVERAIRNPRRAMHNAMADKVLEMERQGATLDDLMPFISGQNMRRALESADLDGGVFAMGQAVGLVDEIKSVAEIIREIVEEAEQQIAALATKIHG